MPTYVLLIRFTRQGIKGFRDTPDRTEEAKTLIESICYIWREFFVAMGRYDGLVVADFPDDETAARTALTLASGGNVMTGQLDFPRFKI